MKKNILALKVSLIKKLGAAACAAAVLLLNSCGGGFGTDSENAKELKPSIFGPDSTRR
ncbi:MAG: hypothetical protein LBI42_03625 [Chitinispirillales bacterium]|jgi:hypothetical protein|nr:hypothetical protein [Chitinispirillales bacterium]